MDTGPDAFIDTLDAILLVFIFVELLYAVRITLKERQIVAEPFLIAGILVCIKEIVVLAVKAPSDYLEKAPSSPGPWSRWGCSACSC
ncbi:MAG: phosphate-starvation-inducible PsiE family protein [Actinomycetota bacterium]|nr:phosphate-starvation-inducible PsiE family protein [Actinomycetota bacterium]